jgi:(p)ppGpp synthase/HD superfamily hydrolase
MAGMTTTLFASVPLKDMDPSALTMAIFAEIEPVPSINAIKVSTAVSAASYFHLNQTRANRKGFPRTAYIEHPLRNALRVLRWGVTSEAILISVILHDTVEDCLPRILKAFVPGDWSGLNETAQRELAYSWIAREFGTGVSDLVRSLTNPVATGEHLNKAQKREKYAQDVKEKISGNAGSFVGKLADFMDNAGGLHHNAVEGNESMIGHLTAKYFPVVAIFQAELVANAAAIRNLVSDEGYADIELKLSMLGGRLGALAGLYGARA